MDSIPFEDHRQILDAAEGRIAELEAENQRLRNSLEQIADEYPHDTWVGCISREALTGEEDE